MTVIELNKEKKSKQATLSQLREELTVSERDLQNLRAKRNPIRLKANSGKNADARAELERIDTEIARTDKQSRDLADSIADILAEIEYLDLRLEIADWNCRKEALRRLIQSKLSLKFDDRLEKLVGDLLNLLTEMEKAEGEIAAALSAFDGEPHDVQLANARSDYLALQFETLIHQIRVNPMWKDSVCNKGYRASTQWMESWLDTIAEMKHPAEDKPRVQASGGSEPTDTLVGFNPQSITNGDELLAQIRASKRLAVSH